MNLKTITCLVLACICITAHAQKVTSSQKNSLRAPANIKIDGKLNEWGDKLQAYSGHTQFYYTMSNDDKYLYLTVQAIRQDIIDRITQGGITLTINRSGKKKDSESIQVTYPVTDSYLGINVKDAPQAKPGDNAAVAALDSFIAATNTYIQQKTKMIKVIGIKGADSLISVYNLDGIKAACAIDHQLRFNYEAAISLKDLGLNIQNPIKFAYQVMINERGSNMITKFSSDGVHKSITVFLIAPDNPNLGGQAATDFWGEYTLAK
ncbi:hypothetical protein [Mucilaginibacter panaciglaebae]|uniref:Uncharacterized protein n=1 Tax=Mucilaginibacter panaciglaebae TaxID=502331 RepID=A0ABP7WBT4_9SPHI